MTDEEKIETIHELQREFQEKLYFLEKERNEKISQIKKEIDTRRIDAIKNDLSL